MDDGAEFVFRGTDRFEVIKPLGSGGMGAVYHAFDRERRVEVALKTLLSFSPDGLLRFKQEFRALQDLNLHHPNLIGMGELYCEGRDWFFTMELVDGTEFLRHVRPRLPPRQFSPEAETVRHAPVEQDLETTAPRIPARGLDEGRLRACLPQLIAGLDALHIAGKVHRDIKPSNVMVTREGRVVILDFGLITDVDRRQQLSQGSVVGTVDYMAPEQAAGEPVGPAADWYALGVVLYEALTGIVPFIGPPLEVLTNKQQLVPQPPRSIFSNIPKDLDALCAQLLRIEPSHRPDVGQIYDCLGIKHSRARSLSIASLGTQSNLFIGREEQLQQLHAAMTDVSMGKARVVYVAGESGVGKTSLVHRFKDTIELTQPDTNIREGRCYERESVPFKAVDSLVDNISRYLMKIPNREAAALLPADVALLAQVFPVLRRVEAVAEAPPSGAPIPQNPREQRDRLFDAVRELFRNLARKQPLVVLIDDLQWADADSLAMLAELMRPPSAPRMLLIATTRVSDSSEGVDPLARLTQAIAGDVLRVDRLSPDEAQQLARLLVKRVASTTTIAPERIAHEAGGHPQFIDELVRHAHLHGVPQTGSVQLEDALWHRITRLETPSRRLMEIVALAAGPLAQDTAAQAAELNAGRFPTYAKVLRAASLVRTSGTRATDTIEPYHDRVRSAVRRNLSTAETQAIHRRIALALQTSGKADPAALAFHFVEAGATDQAFTFACEAAGRAERVLAFDRAAHFYELSLRHAPSGADTQSLLVSLGTALANAGRGVEAARTFLKAAESAIGHDQMTLRSRAASQLLRAGHLDEAEELYRSVQSAIGMPLARTPKQAIPGLLWRRVLIAMRGLRFKELEESRASQHALASIDTGFSVALGLSTVDTVRGSNLQAWQLLRSLRLGEPTRIARGLALQAAMQAAEGGGRKAPATARFVTAAEEMAQRVGDAHALGLSRWAAGAAAYLEGRWKVAHSLNEEALQIYRTRCTGVAWEIASAQAFSLWSLYYLGEIGAIAGRLPALINAARQHGDLYDSTNLRTSHTNIVWLAADDPAQARSEVADAIREWSPSGFHLQHYYELHAVAQADLYEGQAASALKRVNEAWPRMQSAFLMNIVAVRLEMTFLRARASLAVGVLDPALRRSMLTQARKDARTLRAGKMEWSTGFAELIDACVYQIEGDASAAEQRFNGAADVFGRAGMSLHSAIARRQRALVMGGDDGRAQGSAAEALMSGQGILRPERFAAMVSPGQWSR